MGNGRIGITERIGIPENEIDRLPKSLRSNPICIHTCSRKSRDEKNASSLFRKYRRVYYIDVARAIRMSSAPRPSCCAVKYPSKAILPSTSREKERERQPVSQV
jgi:hypothetical protein